MKKSVLPIISSKIYYWLEVNKCTFTFSIEIRQIQRTRTEFDASNAWGPQGQMHNGQTSNSGKCIGFVLFYLKK